MLSLQVAPANPSLSAGSSLQFSATGTYSDGTIQDVTSSVLWSTDSPAVASISSVGVASALVAGTTNVIATYGSVTGTTSLAVTAPVLVSLSITPGTYLLPIAASVQLHALGTYSDGSMQEITASATWSSSSGAATVSSGGLVTAVSAGAATITATAGGLTATTAITSGTAIPASYFGMHIQNVSNWPSANIGALAKGIGTSWNYMEPSPGVYKWALLDGYVNAALSRNIDVVHTFYGVPQWAASATANCQTPATTVQCSGPPANPQDLYDYVTQVVTRYVGRIKYYELWNEPNNTKSWKRTVAAMATQSQAVYNIIKSIDPNALVITPGAATGADNPTQSGWMRMYLLDGGASFADVSSWHAYPKVFPTNTCPQTLDCAGSLLVSQAAAMTSVLNSNGMAGKPVFVTEGGWGQDVTLPDFTQEAAYVSRWHILLASSGVTRAYWYAWGGTNWGTMFDPGISIRPSGTAYEQLENWLTGAAVTPCSVGLDGTWTCSIGRGNGYQALIVWNSSGTASFPGTAGYIQYRDLSGNITTVNGPVTIGTQPIILENMISH
ncbi:MAG: Ig-like domain-containing protein [Acidobacteriales bacterium]|nr:Ig-like domain-containing protein [Terriglobales bacterium]